MTKGNLKARIWVAGAGGFISKMTSLILVWNFGLGLDGIVSRSPTYSFSGMAVSVLSEV